MADSVNQHISATERGNWNMCIQHLNNHANITSIHRAIAAPPAASSGNYYLSNDVKNVQITDMDGKTTTISELQWKKVPIASIV